MMEFLEDEFRLACNRNSDINFHLPMLNNLARLCSHVTEFGVRDGQSTRAFLAAPKCILRSYDLYKDNEVSRLFDIAKQNGRDVDYRIGNTLEIEIEQTDMLFIDTDHTYDQLSKELKKHAWKVNKYLVFHDTDLPCAAELLPAIMEYLANNTLWSVAYHTRKNHGLTVLHKWGS